MNLWIFHTMYPNSANFTALPISTLHPCSCPHKKLVKNKNEKRKESKTRTATKMSSIPLGSELLFLSTAVFLWVLTCMSTTVIHCSDTGICRASHSITLNQPSPNNFTCDCSLQWVVELVQGLWLLLQSILGPHRNSHISCCRPKSCGILQPWMHRAGTFMCSSSS